MICLKEIKIKAHQVLTKLEGYTINSSTNLDQSVKYYYQCYLLKYPSSNFLPSLTVTTPPKKYITSIPKAVKKGDDNIDSLPLISGGLISAVYMTAGVVDIPILNPIITLATMS